MSKDETALDGKALVAAVDAYNNFEVGSDVDHVRKIVGAYLSRASLRTEPVAWQRQHPTHGWLEVRHEDIGHYQANGQEVRALYASPSAPTSKTVEPITLTYTNYRGETAPRTITPRSVFFGSTEWHRDPQWLLSAFDHDKQEERTFALKDFGPAPTRDEVLEPDMLVEGRKYEDTRTPDLVIHGESYYSGAAFRAAYRHGFDFARALKGAAK